MFFFFKTCGGPVVIRFMQMRDTFWNVWNAGKTEHNFTAGSSIWSSTCKFLQQQLEKTSENVDLSKFCDTHTLTHTLTTFWRDLKQKCLRGRHLLTDMKKDVFFVVVGCCFTSKSSIVVAVSPEKVLAGHADDDDETLTLGMDQKTRVDDVCGAVYAPIFALSEPILDRTWCRQAAPLRWSRVCERSTFDGSSPTQSQRRRRKHVCAVICDVNNYFIKVSFHFFFVGSTTASSKLALVGLFRVLIYGWECEEHAVAVGCDLWNIIRVFVKSVLVGDYFDFGMFVSGSSTLE